MNIGKYVKEFPNESSYGFTNKEIEELLKIIPLPENFNRRAFEVSFMGNTCVKNDRGEIVNYPIDVIMAIEAGLIGKAVLYD